MLLLIELDLGATDLLRRSIEATFDRYGRHALPQVLPTPPTGWREAFGQLAIEVGLPKRDLDAAYRRLRVFLQQRGVTRPRRVAPRVSAATRSPHVLRQAPGEQQTERWTTRWLRFERAGHGADRDRMVGARFAGTPSRG